MTTPATEIERETHMHEHPRRASRKAYVKVTKVSEESAARMFEAALATTSERLLSNDPSTVIRRRSRPKLVWINPNSDQF